MNREAVLDVANAVLYEGYLLYPYRRSALKNLQRWAFGILYPPGYEEVARQTERSAMHTECLIEANESAAVRIELRFLQLVTHEVRPSASGQTSSPAPLHRDHRDELVERTAEFEITVGTPTQLFSLDGDRGGAMQAAPGQGLASSDTLQRRLRGTLTVTTETVHDGVWKLAIHVENRTPFSADPHDRDAALFASLLSAHLILTASNGHFLSLLDPPDALTDAAKKCRNVGNFPVLVGTEGERDMLLCSPILLYDYPQVAPESVGDFYDATEMDEMLTLRVMTLTDEEKNQVRQGDEHARMLLERTEQSTHEQLARTHGVIRNLRPILEK
jgi:hydrogenase maturation protease